MTGMEPDAKRRTLSTTFPADMQAAKNSVIDGYEVPVATRNIISEALGPNPTMQEMQQVFPGPMTPEDYEALRAYFSGTEGKSWLDTIGDSMSGLGSLWPNAEDGGAYAPDKD